MKRAERSLRTAAKLAQAVRERDEALLVVQGHSERIRMLTKQLHQEDPDLARLELHDPRWLAFAAGA